jgi:hypothetical protein
VAQVGTNAFVHRIERDATEQYEVIISASGDIKVFSSGTSQVVRIPEGSTYLVASDPNLDFRAVTVGDYTFIVNRTVTVGATTETATAKSYEALIFVKQGDFATKYTLIVDGTEISYTTVDGNDPSQRSEIDTVVIAADIKAQLDGALTGFTTTQYGPVVHIVKADATDFRIYGNDGLGGDGMIIIKDKVQDAELLPRIAKKDFVAEITGSEATEHDNYFVKFEPRGTSAWVGGLASSDVREGVWVETAQPGELIALDSCKMPHVLIRDGAIVEQLTVDQGDPDESSYPITVVTGTPSTYDGAFGDSWCSTKAGTSFTALGADNGLVVSQVAFNTDYASLSSDEDFTLTVHFTPDLSCYEGYTAFIDLMWANGPTTVSFMSSDWSLSCRTCLSIASSTTRQTMDVTRKWNEGDWVCLYLHGNEPWGSSAAYYTVVDSTDGTQPGIQFSIPGTDRKVDFGSSNFFVKGTSVTLRVTPSTGTETSAQIVLSSDETGTNIATLMAAAGTSDDSSALGVTDNGDGTITVTDDAGDPSVTLVDTGHLPARHIITTSLGISTGYDLSSRKVQNLTDGSEGTMASHTDKTIALSGDLTGGTRNTFLEGDEINIVGEASGVFVFRPAVWQKREVGTLQEGYLRDADDTMKRGTNPWPSFMSRKIKDVFYHKGRLGFIADENVILSRTGGLFNFFRKSVQSYIDSEPIDIQATTADVAVFQAVTECNRQLFIWSERAQFILRGEPILTPKTASLTVVSRYDVTPRVRPAVVGDKQYFMTYRTGYTEIMEYYQHPENETFAARSITEHIPGYIAGSGIQIVGSDQYNMLAVLSSTDQRNVYVWNFRRSGDRLLQAAWSRWRFNAGCTVLGMWFEDTKFSLIKKQADGVFVDKMEVDPSATDTGASYRLTYLDRRAKQDDTGYSVDYNVTVAGETVWKLPFDVATDNSEGTLVVIQRANGEIIPTLGSTRPGTSLITTSGSTADYSGVDVYIGLLFDSIYELSQLYVRDEDGVGIRDGRLTIRDIEVAYTDTMGFDVNVNPLNSCDITYSVSASAPGDDGEKYCAVGQLSSDVTLLVKTTGYNPFNIQSLWWRGNHFIRQKHRL